MNKPLTYISLFSSAGVGCYGFKQNGFECIATNEILTKRLKIQAFNNKCKYETGYVDGDISTKEIKKKTAKNNTLHCIEPVIETNNPKTTIPKTMAIFSVTS